MHYSGENYIGQQPAEVLKFNDAFTRQ